MRQWIMGRATSFPLASAALYNMNARRALAGTKVAPHSRTQSKRIVGRMELRPCRRRCDVRQTFARAFRHCAGRDAARSARFIRGSARYFHPAWPECALMQNDAELRSAKKHLLTRIV